MMNADSIHIDLLYQVAIPLIVITTTLFTILFILASVLFVKKSGRVCQFSCLVVCLNALFMHQILEHLYLHLHKHT